MNPPDEHDWGQCALCGEPITGPSRVEGYLPSVNTLAGPRICTHCDDAIKRRDLSRVKFPEVIQELTQGPHDAR